MVRHPGQKWEQLPAFQPPTRGSVDIWRLAVQPIAALTIFLTIAVTSAAVGARRYLR
jgi:hypothetical protein